MTTETLLNQLKHPNPHMQERAMREIAATRDASTIPQLMAALDDENVGYRRAAVKALGMIGVEAVPALLTALQTSDDATVRASCVKAMAQVAFNHPDQAFPEAGLDGLNRALDDPNPVVHLAAVMALGEIGTPALDILLESLQTTENIAVAVAIINALGSIGDARAVEILTTLSEDESADDYVRQSARSALPRLEQVIQLNG